jgi:hypothetical protein
MAYPRKLSLTCLFGYWQFEGEGDVHDDELEDVFLWCDAHEIALTAHCSFQNDFRCWRSESMTEDQAFAMRMRWDITVRDRGGW